MARAGKIEVRVVVEGGGDASVQDGPFRLGYGAFLRRITSPEVNGRPVALEVVRGKGGRQTVDKFIGQRRLYPDALLILLIDSEEPVGKDVSVWDFIKTRHGIDRPAWAEEEHAYLMVQCVETWFVTDPAALAAHYGRRFNADKLPKRTNLEEEPKSDVQRKLGQAIGGKDYIYAHGDSARLIGRVEPSKVATLYHGARLQRGLREVIEAFARH